MKTGNGKLVIKVPSTEQQENLKNSRKTLKVLQQSAENKENLVGRTLVNKYSENETEKPDFKKKKLSNKSIQTGKDNVITVEDLTTEEEPSEQYWKVLAEKRREALDDTLKENEVLHKQIEILKEENKTCKEMLEETKNLVEVLTEMLEEKDTSTAETEAAEEAIEEPECP